MTHHHDHDCTCICHEHEHDHHDHPADCNCGCHTEDIKSSNAEIKITHHDMSTVVTGIYSISAEYSIIQARLSEEMKIAADKIEQLGGIIGHIKASITAQRASTLSITESGGALTVTDMPYEDIRVVLNAIVFAVSDDEAQAIVSDLFKCLAE